MHQIVHVMISYDSTKAITVTKKDNREFWIHMYDLETYEQTFKEMIGGSKDCYIKAKEVQQNRAGNKYAICYIDDGKFRFRLFTKQQRTKKEIEKTEVDVNKLLKINDFTMPINGVADPFICSCFINDDRLFVALFHNFSLTHYHFIYHIEKRKIISGIFSQKLDCTKKNFPQKCFSNTIDNMIHIFYREGYAINVNASNTMDAKIEKFTDQNMGQMFLFNERALICKSSSRVLFFRQIPNEEDEGQLEWKQYHVINIRGFIYFIKGNVRI